MWIAGNERCRTASVADMSQTWLRSASAPTMDAGRPVGLSYHNVGEHSLLAQAPPLPGNADAVYQAAGSIADCFLGGKTGMRSIRLRVGISISPRQSSLK